MIQYGGAYFYVGTAIGGSESSPEYPDVFALDATLDGSELTFSVTNEADERYRIRTWGEPAFGILFAWDGEPHLLEHDQYEPNEAIVTDDGAAYPREFDVPRPDLRGYTGLQPGESLDATYTVPDSVDDEARVYLDVTYRTPLTAHVVWEVTLTE